MNKIDRRTPAFWPQIFIFTFFLVLLRPADSLSFILFLPGLFIQSRTEKIRPLFLWLGWSFFSACLSPDLAASLLDFSRESILAFAGFSAGVYGQKDRRWLWVFQIWAALTIGLILLQAVVAPPFPPSWVGSNAGARLPFRATGLWNNPNRTGLFLAFLLPILLAGTTEGQTSSCRWTVPFYRGLIFLTIPALLFTYSRTAWVAALVALVFYWGRGEKAKLRRLVLIICLLMAFIPSVADRVGENPLQSETVRYRFRIWQETWALVEKYPLTGGGSRKLQTILGPLRADHAHNHYLQLAAEKGLPAVLFFGGLVYRLLKAPGRSGSSDQKLRLERGMQAAVVGQLVAGITESLWVVPLFVFLFWFGFAMITADASRENC